MKNNPEPNSNELANMDPMELLKRYAKFEHFQILGECLGYNPEIAANGTEYTLKNWPYSEATPQFKEGVDLWMKSKLAAPETMRLLLSAATPLFGTPRTYKGILEDIAKDHFKLGIRTSESLADIEQVIMRHILEQALKKIASLPEKEKAKFNEQMSGFLKKQGHDLGSKTALEWLTAPGMAGAGALVGTQLATGIILAHLGVYHGVLFALGLWAIPAGWLAATAALIFAPLMGGALVYILGQHNFKKTIPCVAIIASIRQEALDSLKKQLERSSRSASVA